MVFVSYLKASVKCDCFIASFYCSGCDYYIQSDTSLLSVCCCVHTGVVYCLRCTLRKLYRKKEVWNIRNRSPRRGSIFLV